MPTYSLADLFESVVDVVPDRLALVAGDKRYSFAELDARANRLASHLAGAGVVRGDHIGIYSGNRAEWVEAMWACFKLSAVPININFRYLEDELRYIVDNADLKGMIFEQRYAPLVASVAPSAPLCTQYLVIDDGSAPPVAAIVAKPYEEALAAASPARNFAPRSDDDIYMLYTGGTTGVPKGTIWRHEDLFFAALQGGNPGGAPIQSPEELAPLVAASASPYGALCPVPMMHGGGMWYCMIYQLSGNSFVLYTQRSFDAGRTLELAAKEKVINIILVGDAMARPLVDAIASGNYDTSNLFVIGSGGAFLTPGVKDQLRQLLPNAMIFDSFGASETGSGGAVMDHADASAAGPRFTLSANVAIVDDDLEPIAPGNPNVGRLARSGHIPLGYYKDDKKTAETFQTSKSGVRWVIPGDYARVLADGTAELLGRGSVSINSGGEKIYPEEVEAVIKAHPDVYDAGVIGVPHERFGQQVVALVTAREGHTPEAGEIIEWCRGKIAGYKCPRAVFQVDAIPRTPVSKPDYRRIKALALSLMASVPRHS